MPKRSKGEEEAAGFGAQPRTRITPVDIQQKEFRLAFRGYNERDVDQFLDEVTEDFARVYEENKRLREEMGSQGTARLDVGGAAQAEAVLRQARAEAESILRQARTQAARIPGEAGAGTSPGAGSGSPGEAAPGGAPDGRFLAREREFLQRLATLIQGHAEAVKEDMRRAARPRGPAGGPAGGAPASTGSGQAAAPPPSAPPAPSRGPGAAPGPAPPPSSSESGTAGVTDKSDRARRELVWGDSKPGPTGD